LVYYGYGKVEMTVTATAAPTAPAQNSASTAPEHPNPQ